MNPLIQLKKATPVFLAGLVFACFALSPRVQAVVPAPDGGYAGGNTAEGQSALFSLTTGGFNTAVGLLSLRSNTTGSFNTAVGAGTLLANSGDQNTATGVGALLSNTTGGSNTANGPFALVNNTEGGANTANGVQALYSNTTGGSNTAIGQVALAANTTGSYNTALGAGAGTGNITANNVICIGANVSGQNVSNSCYIGNIYNTTTVSGTTLPVIVSDGGQLGTTPSSRRFKKEIEPMDSASESILALKPVTFHYKSDAKGTPQFGLIAEDVASVNPDLVVRDAGGEIYSVRYDVVNAMLLNEFLKEHKAFLKEQRKVEEQGAMIARQQKDIVALTAGLQKVSDQLKLSKPSPQTVLNRQ
jgi:hypothetical protein